MVKSKSKAGTYNSFSALEALDEVFELQPGIFAGGSVGDSSRDFSSKGSAAASGSDNTSSFFPLGSFLQSSGLHPPSSTVPSFPNADFSDMASALPSLGGDLGSNGSWNFGTLASGLTISAAESEEKAAAEAKKKAELAAANIAMAAAVHTGREREEFRSRLLKGRLDLSTNVRRRKLSKLKSAESYEDRVKARFGGGSVEKRGGAIPVKGLFKKGKRSGGGKKGVGKLMKGVGKKK